MWDEVPFPEDLEDASVSRPQRYIGDDEDFAEASGGAIALFFWFFFLVISVISDIHHNKTIAI